MRVGELSLAVAAMLAGAAALGGEILWTRLLGLVLGHEQLAVLAVLAGLFVGVAIGAGLAHGRASASPRQRFAIVQLVAAGYVVASPWLLRGCANWLPAMLGTSPRPGLGLLISALLLLPATAAFGASLPLLAAARRSARDDGRGLARLYALDTLGATVGVLATVHLLIPSLGLGVVGAVLGALSLGAAGVALLGAPAESAPAPAPLPTTSADPDDDLLRERWVLYTAIGLCGLLGLGLEVVGVRVLAQILSGTIYTFADLLAVWLLGTALGAGAYARLVGLRSGRPSRPATVLVGLLLGLAVLVGVAANVATLAPAILDASSGGALAELAVAAIVLGPPTLVMGACFAHLLALIATPEDPGAPPRPIGRALAINALAAAAAPSVFGLWVLDAWTYAEAWALVAWGYLVLALAIAWLRRFSPRAIAFVSVGGGLAVLSLSAGANSLVLVDDEGEAWELVERHEGPLGVVAVSQSTRAPGSVERPLLRLRVDRQFRMGGALSIGERRMGHLSLLLAGDAHTALFLGLGTGATAGAGTHYDLESLTAVELVPEIVEVLPHFAAVNGGLAKDPRARIVVADARRFLRADTTSYDLIVADLFHPARDGAGSLYTREHFEAAKARLSPGALFVQWLPLYQLDWYTVRILARTFVDVFPEAHAMLALYNARTPALGLVGSREALVVELEQLEGLLAEPARATTYAELALDDPRDFLAGYMLDRDGLLALAGDAPINTDMRPLVEVWAPRAQIDAQTGADNLERLIALRRAWPEALVSAADPGARAAYREASASFAAALDHYLRGEIALLRADGPTRAVASHYLDAYLQEPAFAPARGRLYAIAQADAELAQWLLPAMLERTPEDARLQRAWLDHRARTGEP